MKKSSMLFLRMAVSIFIIYAQENKNPVVFNYSWQLTKQYSCPEWFRDAKFGPWSTWNAYSVPETGDWYACNKTNSLQPKQHK